MALPLAVGFVLYVGTRKVGLTVELDGAIIAVLALAYAVNQFSDAHDTLDSLREVGKELQTDWGLLHTDVDRLGKQLSTLETQLSTHQIGSFPDYLDRIVGLLRSAEHEILIFCDHPGYGSYSNPAVFTDYVEAIQQKASIVRLICLGDTQREKLYREQLHRSGGLESWRNTDNMTQFLNTYGQSTDTPGSIDEARFLELLKISDKKAYDEDFSMVKKATTSQIMPLSFWVSDRGAAEDKAVFALAPFTQDVLEIGFETRDPNLIGALRGIFERWPHRRWSSS